MELLPQIITAVAGIVVSILTYFFGRKKNNAEVKKLEGEKKSVEAAAGLSTAEAASIISRAAADVVQPLTNRIRELQQELKDKTDRHAAEMSAMSQRYSNLEFHVAEVTKENVALKNKVAHLEAKIALLSKPHELANETSKRLGDV